MALYMWLKRTKVRSQTESDEIINEEAKSSNTVSLTADVDDCGHGSKSTESPQEEKKAEKVSLKRKINQQWFEEFGLSKTMENFLVNSALALRVPAMPLVGDSSQTALSGAPPIVLLYYMQIITLRNTIQTHKTHLPTNTQISQQKHPQ